MNRDKGRREEIRRKIKIKREMAEVKWTWESKAK